MGTIFPITGYQNYYRARGVFPTRESAKKYLESLLTDEEKKYLTVLYLNSKELENFQKKHTVYV